MSFPPSRRKVRATDRARVRSGSQLVKNLKMYQVLFLLLIFCTVGSAVDEKLVPLRSTCTNSVQCVGVAVCMDGLCRCPPSYTPIGNTCVHSGMENSLSSDQFQLLSSERYSVDKENPGGLPGVDVIRIGSSLMNNKSPTLILNKIASTASPPAAGYPGQPCGNQNECRGNSFCYKSTCSCHAGAIVSGRVCVMITSGSKMPKTATTVAPRTRTTSRSTPKSTTAHRSPLGVEHICPPPLFWADGDCMAPGTVSPLPFTENFVESTKSDLGASIAMCKPPLVIVDGWCTLPSSISVRTTGDFIRTSRVHSLVTPSTQSRCPPSTMWIEGRCVSPRAPSPNIPPPFLTPLSPSELTGADMSRSIAIPPPSSARRCPPGEILINSACLSIAVVVNYPTPLLCRSGADCPGGSTCLSHFCVCPAPFVWSAKTGCDSPSLAAGAIDSDNEMTVVRNPVTYNSYRPTANGYVPLGKRCSRDSDCIERAVCEYRFRICTCRAPFVPYSSMCIFAPTEEEIASAIQ